METTPLWTLIPTVTAFALALMLTLVARHKSWSDAITASPLTRESSPQKNGSTADDFKTRARNFVSAYRWEILLAGVLVGLLTFIALSSPVQLTGKLSIYPNQPGRPFYFLHWIRNHLVLFYHETASASNLLTGLAALVYAILAGVQRSHARSRASLLWASMSLAGAAQWMVSSENQLQLGIYLYLTAAAGFFFWSRLAHVDVGTDLDEKRPIPFRWEVVLVALVLILATFSRMYTLRTIPYGIEGDEAKWTAEVVSLGLRGDPDGNGIYHRDALPGSFFMQTVFHRLLGPSLISARFEVALFSVIATLVFYLFLRQITSMPMALLAAWLLSGCMFDISASRLANVESHVKLWPVLTLALLAWALEKKQWHAYAITGIALAIGLLTYDTVWPLGLLALILTIIESIRQKEKPGKAIQNIMALLIPSMLVAPVLVPYITGRMFYYEIGNKGWGNGLETLLSHTADVFTSWYRVTYQDFLYNRTGPLLNAFLLPWMTLGVAAALANPRHRLSLWTLIWVLLFIFPVPVLAHSPFGRVYYPALPAMYVLVAIGMYIFARETLRSLGSDFRPLITAAAMVILIWIPLFNLYIYFNEVEDSGDRVMRREVAELAKGAASPDTLIVLASVPNYDEPLNNEFQMIELFMLEKLPIEQISSSYKKVALENVLPTLVEISSRPNRSIILDTFSPNSRPERDALAEALRKCFPQAKWTKGVQFDRVDISAEAVESSTCISTVLSLEFVSENRLSWQLTNGTASRISLKCDIQQVNHEALEAETLPIYPGWQTETAFASDWKGSGFLMDNYGSQPILFDIEVDAEKPVYIWVRYYKRSVDNSPAQISLGGSAFSFANINEDKLNQWNWERIGPFNPSVGMNTLTLERPYLEDPFKFIAVFIDSLIVTSDEGFTPSNSQFEKVPTMNVTIEPEKSSGTLTIAFEPGSYRCTAEAVNRSLVDAFGNSPVISNTIDFKISP